MTNATRSKTKSQNDRGIELIPVYRATDQTHHFIDKMIWNPKQSGPTDEEAYVIKYAFHYIQKYKKVPAQPFRIGENTYMVYFTKVGLALRIETTTPAATSTKGFSFDLQALWDMEHAGRYQYNIIQNLEPEDQYDLTENIKRTKECSKGREYRCLSKEELHFEHHGTIEVDRTNLTFMGVPFPDLKSLDSFASDLALIYRYSDTLPTVEHIENHRDLMLNKITIDEYLAKEGIAKRESALPVSEEEARKHEDIYPDYYYTDPETGHLRNMLGI